MNISKIFYQKLIFVILILSTLGVTSCTKKYNYNKKFKKEFEQELLPHKKIEPKNKEVPIAQRERYQFSPLTEREIKNKDNDSIFNNYSDSVAYIPNDYFNNGTYFYKYDRNLFIKHFNGKIPDDAFIITYNTELHPAYKKFYTEFDYIIIPAKDIFGVESKLEQKEYILVDTRILQINIDDILDNRTKKGINITNTLIKEKKNYLNSK